MENRVKFGYLYYNDMLQKIADGIIDQHDIVFTKDTKEIYIISKDYEPIALKSKVYVYNSLAEAISGVNKNTDTYIGQVISILEGDVYRGYIVNEDKYKRGLTYTVSPLTDISNIDYNTLGNKPIINLVGTLDEPITVSKLDNGTYSITGQYKIDESEITTFLNASPVIVIIETKNNETLIKQISSMEIVDYRISNGLIEKKSYVTETFLQECGYATTNYVDEKIAALDFVTRNEVNTYVEQLINEIIENVLDAKIDEKIDEKIQPVSEEYVVGLFN